MTVDQDQVALRAEAAQVDRGRAIGAVVDVLAVARHSGREDADDLLNRGLILQRDFLRADREDRARRLDARQRDARTGDDNLLDFGVLRDRRDAV